MSLSLLIAVACKPSVEGETKKWDARKNAVSKLKESYPRFSGQLDAALLGAEAAMKTAQAEGNAEKKAKAMAGANEMLDSKLIRQLGSVRSRNESIDRDIKKLTSKKVPASNVKRIDRLIASARSKQREATGALATGDVATAESATQTADDAVSKLISASGDVSSAEKLAKRKK